MNKRIVIADDSESTRYVVRLALAKTNATIIEAENGVEALGLFDGRSIDLLITDYNMPEMNGEELIYSVRNLKNYSSLPILLLTGKERDIEDSSLISQIQGWIPKPFVKDSFLKTVHQYIYNEILQ